MGLWSFLENKLVCLVFSLGRIYIHHARNLAGLVEFLNTIVSRKWEEQRIAQDV